MRGLLAALFLGALAAGPALAQQDTIRLTLGNELTGTVQGFANGELRLVVPGGREQGVALDAIAVLNLSRLPELARADEAMLSRTPNHRQIIADYNEALRKARSNRELSWVSAYILPKILQAAAASNSYRDAMDAFTRLKLEWPAEVSRRRLEQPALPADPRSREVTDAIRSLNGELDRREWNAEQKQAIAMILIDLHTARGEQRELDALITRHLPDMAVMIRLRKAAAEGRWSEVAQALPANTASIGQDLLPEVIYYRAAVLHHERKQHREAAYLALWAYANSRPGALRGQALLLCAQAHRAFDSAAARSLFTRISNDSTLGEDLREKARSELVGLPES